MSEPETIKNIEARIIALEEKAMYLDHLLGELNGVVCSIQSRLDAQNAALASLAEAISRRAVGGEEKRTLEDEKPPHY